MELGVTILILVSNQPLQRVGQLLDQRAQVAGAERAGGSGAPICAVPTLAAKPVVIPPAPLIVRLNRPTHHALLFAANGNSIPRIASFHRR
jgi:hypothetical protein